jgi:hypothetical protein
MIGLRVLLQGMSASAVIYEVAFLAALAIIVVILLS